METSSMNVVVQDSITQCAATGKDTESCVTTAGHSTSSAVPWTGDARMLAADVRAQHCYTRRSYSAGQLHACSYCCTLHTCSLKISSSAGMSKGLLPAAPDIVALPPACLQAGSACRNGT